MDKLYWFCMYSLANRLKGALRMWLGWVSYESEYKKTISHWIDDGWLFQNNKLQQYIDSFNSSKASSPWLGSFISQDCLIFASATLASQHQKTQAKQGNVQYFWS